MIQRQGRAGHRAYERGTSCCESHCARNQRAASRVIRFTAVHSCRAISELAMPRITETATIGLDPETLWNEIGAFGSVGDWHPLLDSVEVRGQGTGAMRIAHAKEGAEQAERL